MLKPLFISAALGCVFEIGDQGFVKDERTHEQLAIIVQPLQKSGDPTEFLVLFWSLWIVFNEANKPAIWFLDLYSRAHQTHGLVDLAPLKHEKLEDCVLKGVATRSVNSLPEMGEMLNVGFSDALPPMLRLRKLVPFDPVSSPLAPSVVVQLNVAAMLEVDVK